MFSFLNRNKKVPIEVFHSVSAGMKQVYHHKLLPLEEAYKFHEFHQPALDDADFFSKPMVLLVGQYSTGKTSFIRYLLESDFPGIRVGPEPTTDSFIAVMHGEQEAVVPGNALVMDSGKPFRQLSSFGNAFLNRFQCSTMNNEVLKSVSFVDTPGILSGEKQRIDRGYSMNKVIEWFSARVDRIILLFDAHKLDISDELKAVMEGMRGYEDKIRIVLNKADMVNSQQLMRVYGALMWSLGKVLQSPETARVYIGSFWNEPLKYDANKRLFELEAQDLFKDLQSLPGNSSMRKMNDLIKRARLAKTHAFIMAALRNEMPAFFGKDAKKKQLIRDLQKVFQKVAQEQKLSPGDLPDVARMQQVLASFDFSTLPPFNDRLISSVDSLMSEDIANLMAMIPKENMSHGSSVPIEGGVFEQPGNDTPFEFDKFPGVNEGKYSNKWIIDNFRQKYDAIFEKLEPVDDKISGSKAKEEMCRSNLPHQQLAKIWRMADIDKDGMLDKDEFALAKYLIDLRLRGCELPQQLPEHLVPPGKKRLH